MMADKDENLDMEVQPDINDSGPGEDLPRWLPLGSYKGEKFGTALAKKKVIIQMAQMLQLIADLDVEAEQESQKEEQAERKLIKQVSIKDHFSSCVRKVINTLDIVLEWLEQSSRNARDEIAKSRPRRQTDETDAGTEKCVDDRTSEYQEKREGVLRGLYHITGLGSFPCHVGLLEFACKFLDLPENPCAAKREHVKECLRDVQEQNKQVFELIEEACNILQEITNDPHVNQSNTAKFNSIVRQANVLIESCNDFLSLADETIDELIQIMSTMKIFSRVVRFAGFGVTCLGLYRMKLSSSTLESLTSYIPSAAQSLINPSAIKYFSFATACAVSGYTWLSLFPSKVYEFREDLADLKFQHKRLTLEINRLDRRLKNAVNDFDDKSKRQSFWEDSV